MYFSYHCNVGASATVVVVVVIMFVCKPSTYETLFVYCLQLLISSLRDDMVATARSSCNLFIVYVCNIFMKHFSPL